MNETHLPANEIVKSSEQLPELARTQFQQDILITNPEYAPDVVALFAEIQNSGALATCDLESEGVKTEAFRLVMTEIHSLLEQGKTPEKICKIIPKKLPTCLVNARVIAKQERNEATQQEELTLEQDIEASQEEDSQLAQTELKQSKTIAEHQALFNEFISSNASQGTLDEYKSGFEAHIFQTYGADAANEKNEYALRMFDEYEANLQQIEGVFTPEEVDTLFAGSVSANVMLNLSAHEPMAIYGDVFTRIEQSDLPQERKDALRQSTMNVLGQIERETDTGIEVVRGTTQMVLNGAGKKVPAHPEDNPLDLGSGVKSYTRTGNEVILKAEVGGHIHTADVTGWSPQAVGSYTEALKFWAGTEAFGATGFVESVYKIDFSVLGNSVLDPFEMVKIRQKISYLVGGFEAYDGDIFDPSEKKGLIQAQMRALSPNDTAYGWENDQHQTHAITQELGLDNPLVLKEFGAYTQAHYLNGDITHEALHDHLYKRFPQFVAKPELKAA